MREWDLGELMALKFCGNFNRESQYEYEKVLLRHLKVARVSEIHNKTLAKTIINKSKYTKKEINYLIKILSKSTK